jgi:hypothetical protein
LLVQAVAVAVAVAEQVTALQAGVVVVLAGVHVACEPAGVAEGAACSDARTIDQRDRSARALQFAGQAEPDDSAAEGSDEQPARPPEDDTDDEKKKPTVQNRAPAEVARASIFQASSLQRLSLAQAKALQPLIERLGSIEELPEADQGPALAKLRADLPALYAQVLRDPALATAFEEILGTALVDGYATAATQKTSP